MTYREVILKVIDKYPQLMVNYENGIHDIERILPDIDIERGYLESCIMMQQLKVILGCKTYSDAQKTIDSYGKSTYFLTN